MVLGIWLLDGFLLASHCIIAALLAMLLGRFARWDRQRREDAAASKPTSQERLLADFCENTAIGMSSIAPNGRILWANKAELQMLDYEPQDYVGHHLTEFHIDPAAMSEILRHMRAGEPLREFEAQLRCRDGSVKEVLIDSSIQSRGGELISTRLFTRDITEQRRNENEQRELYSRYETLITRSSAGIFETDSKGRCMFVNQKWCELSGLPMQQALGVGWKRAIHPEDRDRELEILQRNMNQGLDSQVEWRFLTPDGRIIWVHGSVVPLKQDHDVITGFLGTVTDISALKKAEAVICEARNQAEAANRIKSEFLANMSHEMRTPLNGIIGMTELALDIAEKSEQIECLQTVKESADSLLTIINELLDFAKVESGKIILDRVLFNLGDWMRDSLKPLIFRCRQKGLDFRCYIDSNIPKQLVGDPEWLRHILVNLVSNAVKFTDKGYVRVSAHLQPATIESAEDQESVLSSPVPSPHSSITVVGMPCIRLHFAVEDSGIGIPTHKHEAIFAPFEQADKSITRRYGGTGLGLSIARQLAGIMQGRVWLESRLNKGSTFHFTCVLHLPGATTLAPRIETKPQLIEKSPESFAAPPRQLRVLVVEDNVVNQQLIVRLLHKRGHRTEIAGDGVEALEKIGDSAPFDVVLMDMQMPRLGGLEATTQIRRNERGTNRHIPVVALTASVLKGDKERCIAAGMDAYLTKPVNREELFQTLESLTNRGAAMDETVETFESDCHVLSDCDHPQQANPGGTVIIKGTSAAPQTIFSENHSQVLSRSVSPESAVVEIPQPLVKKPLPVQDGAQTGMIDHRKLWKVIDGDRELLKELLVGYRETCPQIVTELRDGVARKDSTQVQRSAHKLKGMVGSFAAEQAYSKARDLEYSARDSDFGTAASLLQKLEGILGEVDEELSKMANCESPA